MSEEKDIWRESLDDLSKTVVESIFGVSVSEPEIPIVYEIVKIDYRFIEVLVNRINPEVISNLERFMKTGTPHDMYAELWPHKPDQTPGIRVWLRW